MNIIVNKMLVRYNRQGSGKPIVLLHGWGDKLETFDAISSILQQNYEVIRLDLAGFGSSQPPETSWGLDDYANQVAATLAKLEIIPYAIIGHSNGGAISIKGLSTSTLAASKLVLIASAGIRNDQKARKAAWLVAAKVGKAATLALPAGARKKLRNKLYSAAGSDILVSPHMEATFKRIVNEDVSQAAQSIAIPTLILNGTLDTATPPVYAKAFHQAIRGSKLELIENADHFVHQRHVEKVAELVQDFLA